MKSKKKIFYIADIQLISENVKVSSEACKGVGYGQK